MSDTATNSSLQVEIISNISGVPNKTKHRCVWLRRIKEDESPNLTEGGCPPGGRLFEQDYYPLTHSFFKILGIFDLVENIVRCVLWGMNILNTCLTFTSNYSIVTSI